MQLPFNLRKDQGRKGGLNVKTWRHQQLLAHTEGKSGRKEHPSMSSQEYTPSQVRDFSESGGPDRFPAMDWPVTLTSLGDNGQRCWVRGHSQCLQRWPRPPLLPFGLPELVKVYTRENLLSLQYFQSSQLSQLSQLRLLLTSGYLVTGSPCSIYTIFFLRK